MPVKPGGVSVGGRQERGHEPQRVKEDAPKCAECTEMQNVLLFNVCFYLGFSISVRGGGREGASRTSATPHMY